MTHTEPATVTELLEDFVVVVTDAGEIHKLRYWNLPEAVSHVGSPVELTVETATVPSFGKTYAGLSPTHVTAAYVARA